VIGDNQHVSLYDMRVMPLPTWRFDVNGSCRMLSSCTTNDAAGLFIRPPAANPGQQWYHGDSPLASGVSLTRAPQHCLCRKSAGSHACAHLLLHWILGHNRLLVVGGPAGSDWLQGKAELPVSKALLPSLMMGSQQHTTMDSPAAV
jgi:hypothetical protein